MVIVKTISARETKHLINQVMKSTGLHDNQSNCAKGVQWEHSIVDTLGPGEVCCIELIFQGGGGEIILRKHIWDIAKCP